MAIGVPIATGLPRLYQQCTNRQKQSNSKQMKIGVLHQSSHVYTESAEYTKSAPASAEYTKPYVVTASAGTRQLL